MIKPLNQRITATEFEVEKGELGAIPGTNAQLDKFMKVTVVKSSVADYKRGDVLVVPSYVDRVKDGKKEYLIFHESDVVAICE
jgi:co-chaperonin GroES (HSP10)